MSCLDRFKKEALTEYEKRNDDSIGSDSELIANTIAICFDELIAELSQKGLRKKVEDTIKSNMKANANSGDDNIPFERGYTKGYEQMGNDILDRFKYR